MWPDFAWYWVLFMGICLGTNYNDEDFKLLYGRLWVRHVKTQQTK
jgi:hypothetical protein